MITIDLIDYKGDEWELVWANAPTPYLHEGMKYWKAWWYAPVRPKALKDYAEVPIPIFTEWWPHVFTI